MNIENNIPILYIVVGVVLLTALVLWFSWGVRELIRDNTRTLLICLRLFAVILFALILLDALFTVLFNFVGV